jgi:hypothetical protein
MRPEATTTRGDGSEAGPVRARRSQIRTADLLKAQLAVLEALACGDDRRVAIAEERVAQCMQRLVKAALVLDRVLAERGDNEGRRMLVEGALQLTSGRAGSMCTRTAAQ